MSLHPSLKLKYILVHLLHLANEAIQSLIMRVSGLGAALLSILPRDG